MAEEVFRCIHEKSRLLIEAGTGVGKTFAYLIPAILSGEKTVVSTASIALQDQLINKDLILLADLLDRDISFAILKGKNNYLCLKREREFAELGETYQEFMKWASETETGDREELHFIPDFWPRVCGDSDDCSVNLCPFYNECFYFVHFRSLYEKDILVVNHHMLVYDMLSDFNLIPFHTNLIIDEAHQLENVIAGAVGSVLNYSKMIWLIYRMRALKISVDHLFEPVESFFKRMDIPVKTVSPLPEGIIESLKNLKELFAFDKVIKRLDAAKDSASGDEMRDRIETTIKYINGLEAVIEDFIGQGDKDKVYFMNANKKSIELRSSLVESSGPFRALSEGYESIVLTSATLTTGRNFSFLKERLGITDFGEKVIGSPFNYGRQALIYIEKNLPSPVRENNGIFQEKSVSVIEDLINASEGRALVLFTSYNHLNYVSERIDVKYPMKVQGEMPPSRLISWFKKTDNSVLLATSTFWQGIDIKGDDLSIVIISKMPFGSPGDPVYDERCRRLGDRWFSDLALPSAILLLRQGFGRLIRGTSDRGVIAVLDSRLVRSSYGKTIVSSLPAMNIVHDTDEVRDFFNRFILPT